MTNSTVDFRVEQPDILPRRLCRTQGRRDHRERIPVRVHVAALHVAHDRGVLDGRVPLFDSCPKGRYDRTKLREVNRLVLDVSTEVALASRYCLVKHTPPPFRCSLW